VIVEVLTLFPGLFPGPLTSGVTGRGMAAGLVSLRIHNLRDYTHDRHRQVDDIPYGGGAGMVLKPCLLYTSPSPRDLSTSRMPSSA